MKAMIMAAGRGERMRPITDTIPKPLLEVQGRPLIMHHIEALANAGINRFVINLCWLGDQIRDLLGDGTAFNVRIEYSEEHQALDVAGGIVQALDRLGERFVVVNADIVTDFDFTRLKDLDYDAHLVLVENPQHHPEGDFTLQDLQVGNDGGKRYTFSGIAQYHRRFFAGLEPGKRPLAPMLRQAAELKRVGGELFHGKWVDIGTPERWRSIS